MKTISFTLLILLQITSSYSQEVTASATTNKKEVEAILKKERTESRINAAYFAEHDRCRQLLRAKDLGKAEVSCRLAVSLSEKLPREQVLERSSALQSLAVVLLLQRKPQEPVVLLNKALEVSQSVIDDDDAETGELYFVLANAHSLLNDTQTARRYLEKAEDTYRSAFIKIDDDEMRRPYSRMIRNIVEAHFMVVKLAGLAEEAERLRGRLEKVEKDFARYLID